MNKKKKPNKRRLYISAAVIAFIIAGGGSAGAAQQVRQKLQERTSTTLSPVTQATSCDVVLNLPDKQCTPGAIWTSAGKSQICLPGYTRLVRRVDNQTKAKIYKIYDISDPQPGQYEIDHLVSLQLGGSNDEANLWPLATDIKNQKDQAENYLKRQVCDDKLPLETAQKQIADDWKSVYMRITPLEAQ